MCDVLLSTSAFKFKLRRYNKVAVKEVFVNALQGWETANFEFPLFTKDQTRVDVLLNATTRRDPNGDITGVVGVGQGGYSE
jgi:hypothetical protein